MRCPKCGGELVWSPKNSRYCCHECEICPVPGDVSERQFNESVPRDLKRIADALWIVIYIGLAYGFLIITLLAILFMFIL